MSFPDAVGLGAPARHFVCALPEVMDSVTSVVMAFLKEGSGTGKYFACIVVVI